ncbi:MAG: response regulator [Longimicrobiales bacterium]
MKEATTIRVLVVEYDADVRCTTVEALRRRGHEIRAVEDGGTATALARSWAPDVVFLGIAPPRLDGWTAHRIATQAHGTGRIPVVAITAEQGGEISPVEGIVALLRRPLTADEILKAAERHALKNEG